MKQRLAPQKEKACADNLAGTYEEMYSNWRNKMYLAAKTDNAHLSFMSVFSANHMLSEIYENVEIDKYDAYLKEYGKAGMQEKRYGTIEEFVADYLR